MLSYLKTETQGRLGILLNLGGFGQPGISGVQACAASCETLDTADGTYLRTPQIEVTPA